MEIRNFTGTMERGVDFVRAKAALVCTEGLSIHVKHTSARGRDVNGYYRWDDRRMVLAVRRRLRYPRTAAYAVATTPRPEGSRSRLPFRLVWHEERFEGPDDLLVFVAGHEFWHFLCHSGQRRRDHETKANRNGFAWLREFQSWAGQGRPVAPIHDIPPLPGAGEARGGGGGPADAPPPPASRHARSGTAGVSAQLELFALPSGPASRVL